MKRLLDIIIILLLLVFTAVNRGRLFGRRLQPEPPEKAARNTMTLETAQRLFPEATTLTDAGNGVYEVGGNGGKAVLGFVTLSSPDSDNIAGFMGPTPLLIGLDATSKIVQVIALENNESPGFFDKVRSSGLLNAWNGLSVTEAATHDVDTVTGATFSSRSVIDSMRARMGALGDIQPKPVRCWKDWAADAALLLLVGFSLAGFFRPSLFGRKGRRILLAASIAILAIWQGRLLSIAQLVTWFASGIPLAAQWGVLLLFLLAVALPLIFGKAFYCTWLCPMGAAQELAGLLGKGRSLSLGATCLRWLQTLRGAILYFGLLVTAIGIGFDFSMFEAFTLFRPSSAPMAALVLGILSLILSIWLPRPWCRFLCPLGELLETLRRKPSPTPAKGTARPS